VSFLQTKTNEVRAPETTVLPDGRKRLTRFFQIAHRGVVPPDLDYPWATPDTGTAPAGWTIGLRLVGKELHDDTPQPGEDSHPELHLVFEEISATAETTVGGTSERVLEDGRIAVETSAVQFSSNTFVPGIVGAAGSGATAGYYLLKVDGPDDGTVRRITRTWVQSGILATDDESLQGGALLKKSITSAVTVPSTPAGYTLVGSPVQSPAGYPVYTYTFWKGAGLVEDDLELKDGGALKLYHRIALGSAPANPTGGGGTLTSIFVTNGGSGYTSAPTVAITGGGGSGGTATAVLSGGSITSLTLTNGGSGYTSAPTVAITGGGGTGATATAALAAGSIASAALVNAGSGFTSAPAVGVSGGGGASGAVTAALTPTSIASVAVTNPGSGYTSAPTVAITGGGGTGATATAVLSGGSITAVTITNAGTGYTSAPTIGFTGGGGTGAAATANMTSGVGGLIITNQGGAYSTAFAITFSGGGGSGAAATAYVNGGIVIGYHIDNPGSGYTSPPTPSFAAGDGSGAAGTALMLGCLQDVPSYTSQGGGYATPPTVTITGGGGTGAQATCFVSGGQVTYINVTNGGSGYTSPATLNFSGGGGSGAAGTLAPQGNTGVVGSVTMTNGGSGYSSAPTVGFSGGGGTGAAGTAAAPTSTVASVTITNPGSGYTSAPAVGFSGGGGSAAAGTAALTPTSLASLTVTNGGSGYTSAPTLAITGGGGSGATATATLAARAVASLTITNNGTGYTSAPSVGFSGGGGTGAAATAAIPTLSVAGVTITNAGSGYTSAPTVGFSGGAGSGATAIAPVGLAALIVANFKQADGYTIYDYTWAAGVGEISRAIEYTQSSDQGTTGVTRTTIRYLSASSQTTLLPATLAGSVNIGAEYADQDGYRIWTTSWAKGTGTVTTDVETKNGGKLALYHRIALGAAPTTPTATIGGTVTLVTANTHKEAGFDVYDYTWAEGVGEIGRDVQYHLSNDQGATGATLTTITYLTASSVTTNPTTGPAGSVLVSLAEKEQDGYRVWTAEYAQGTGTIKTTIEYRHGGKLVLYHIKAINTPPSAPAATIGGTVTNVTTDAERSGRYVAPGLLIYEYTWAEGLGEISRAVDYLQSSDQGTTGITRTTIRYLSAGSQATLLPATLAGSVNLSASYDDQDGYRIWTTSWAKGTGTVTTDVETRNGGKLILYHRMALGGAPTTPTATIGGTVTLVTANTRKEAGFDLYDYTWAEGVGEISRAVEYTQSLDQGTNGITRTTIRYLCAASQATLLPSTLAGSINVGADYADQDGYRIWTTTWAKGTGLVAQQIHARQDGLREVTNVALGTRSAPVGIVIRDDYENSHGFTIYTVTSIQKADGGSDPTAATMVFERYVPFMYPGRAKVYAAVASDGWTANDCYLSPPVKTEVQATVTVSYTTSNTIGTISDYWNPSDWAVLRAEWVTDFNRQAFLLRSLPGYRSMTLASVTFTATAAYGTGGGAAMGNRMFVGSTCKLTCVGGPADPAATPGTHTLDVTIEPAFTGTDGTKYYRKTVVTATILAQNSLPV